MPLLTLRTDAPEAEIGLYDDSRQIAYEVWTAHRKLAETLHARIRDMLAAHRIELAGIEGIVVFQGPGSFTGLRIGLSVANALAAALYIPIVAVQGEGWIAAGIERLGRGENDVQALPEYGAPVHITPQKK